MKKMMITLALAALSAGALPAQAADTLTYNGTPTTDWQYGSGNDYIPSNTTVLTTDAGDELYLRMHETFETADPSVGGVYYFPVGTENVSYDWGLSAIAGSLDGITALLTFTNHAGGSFAFDPFLLPDNYLAGGTAQNSGRLKWYAPLNFDWTVDGTYDVTLDVFGLTGGQKTVTATAVLGDGFQAAVPEPATWLMLILGFGAIGATMRSRRKLGAALPLAA